MNAKKILLKFNVLQWLKENSYSIHVMHKYVSIKWNVFWQVCQCFVFCALLEFALVNYASRSDMQRDRARERNERARRQWELEHADMQQLPPGSGPPTSGGGIPTSGSQTPGNNVTSMNHLGSSDALDGIPGYSLVSKLPTIVHLKFLSFILLWNPWMEDRYKSGALLSSILNDGKNNLGKWGANCKNNQLKFAFWMKFSSNSYLLRKGDSSMSAKRCGGTAFSTNFNQRLKI